MVLADFHNINIEGKIYLTMDVAITKMSSKGQVVIPADLRKGMREGDKLLIIRNKDQIIMKRTSALDLEEDLSFAKKTEAAYKRIKAGKGTRKDLDSFIEDMRTW